MTRLTQTINGMTVSSDSITPPCLKVPVSLALCKLFSSHLQLLSEGLQRVCFHFLPFCEKNYIIVAICYGQENQSFTPHESWGYKKLLLNSEG